jgi:chemotaxis protein CheX
MTVNEELLRNLTTDVCTSMLELDLTPQDDYSPAGEPYLVAMVRILGEQLMGVEVAVPHGLAQHIAAVMFATTAQDVAEDEVLDAIGEVANMIGGGVKGLFAGESQLSLPCVGEVSQNDYDFSRNGECISVHFECQGQQFLVRYTEREKVNSQLADSTTSGTSRR